ncbi:helix-turn-helix transcriptional regulator [Bradyrhizobium sp. Arg816]|uniref:helix-turn-helix transcriptional regulator n=1 Tax=Bradyrhizobium sp. Arg816 TaxID=2998491 RepID=UPI00249E03C1|nr:helix-turn-helix transcriptional regulator [Bradyrhizobium sp. Arg816]MDI3566837.1 helix-turn-helix transcriptional regulator [Bradyrhizobium sp. Arg816]
MRFRCANRISIFLRSRRDCSKPSVPAKDSATSRARLSPHKWLLKRRVDQAKSLLRDRTLPLSDVALSCGFNDQSHFTRFFAKLTGVTPGAWRRHLY